MDYYEDMYHIKEFPDSFMIYVSTATAIQRIVIDKTSWRFIEYSDCFSNHTPGVFLADNYCFLTIGTGGLMYKARIKNSSDGIALASGTAGQTIKVAAQGGMA